MVNAQHGSRSEVVRAGVDRTARSANFASKFEDVSERLRRDRGRRAGERNFPRNWMKMDG